MKPSFSVLARVSGLILTIFFTTSCAQPQREAEPEIVLDSDLKKASYQVGFDMTERLRGQFGGALDDPAFQAGVADVLAGSDSRVSAAEAQNALQALLDEQKKREEEKALATAEEGAAYLAKNAEREEVTVLESGLQYEVLAMGEGDKPAVTDQVTTHYEGRLIDGTVFDSSYQRGQPATFPLNGVISGWTEGLQLMPTGSKWRLYLPPELAYGDRGAPPSIPPKSTLVFDVELLGIAE